MPPNFAVGAGNAEASWKFWRLDSLILTVKGRYHYGLSISITMTSTAAGEGGEGRSGVELNGVLIYDGGYANFMRYNVPS